MEPSDGGVTLERATAVWKLSHVLDESMPQEIVTLTSWLDHTTGLYTASAVRTWVTDVNGDGLEADLMDPVTILEAGPERLSLMAFHNLAVNELERRRLTDYEVADLFVCDP
jgi:hypothetical protein